MGSDVAVLVSSGRHPVSGRSRMAPADAAAVELALRLTPDPAAIHVGRPDDAALRDYLGMGLATLTVLEGPGQDDDILPVLHREVEVIGARLVVMGERAETGEASGMLPYLLAKRLGYTLLPQAIDLARDGARIVAMRQLPGGRRHRIAASGAALVTVPSTGVATRLPAFGLARRGRIQLVAVSAPPDLERRGWRLTPARARPPRLRPGATRQASGSGIPLTGLSPREAAEAIHGFLTAHGILGQ